MSSLSVAEPEVSNAANLRFLTEFAKAKGALPLLTITTLYAIGFGSTVGIIPTALGDRYARLYYGYNDTNCATYDFDQKPSPCQNGSDQAQEAAAWSNGALSIFLLFCGPLIGSWSDQHGRRPVLLLSLVLSCVPALFFLLIQIRSRMSPLWYYASFSLLGIAKSLSTSFAMLSDVLPTQYRTAGYGVLLAGFYGGYSLAPSLPLFLSLRQTAFVSLFVLLAAFVYAYIYLPETLPDAGTREETVIELVDFALSAANDGWSCTARPSCWRTITRPLRELSILGRDGTLQILTASSFVASMVFASDHTLLIYYLEDTLNVRPKDFAVMFFALAIAGVVLQGGLLQPLLLQIGEHRLLLVTFVCGTLHNFLYGIGKAKWVICVALVLSQLTKLNLPILSSLASKSVSANEQGRLQGALFANNAVAGAVGTLLMEWVYHVTKHRKIFGPGFMFVFAAGLYAFGTVLVALLLLAGKKAASSTASHDQGAPDAQGLLQEPLLPTADDDVSEARMEIANKD